MIQYFNNKNKDPLSEDFLEKPITSSSERFMKGATSLGNTAIGIIKKIAPKNGFVNIDIITNWNEIAGAELAPIITPVKISFPTNQRTDGTLYVKIKNASLSSIVQYQFPMIIDRVNTYFGYHAVKNIKIKY